MANTAPRARRFAPRRAVACVAALAAVLAAGPAAAGIVPWLHVASLPGGKTRITFEQFDETPATWPQSIILYAPAGLPAHFDAAAGATVGTLSGTASLADAGDAEVELEAPLIAADVDSTVVYGGFEQELSDISRNCAGDATPTAAWVARTTLGAQELDVPVFVTLVRPGSVLALAGVGVQITLCFAPSDLAFGARGRAPLGARIVDVQLVLTRVFAPGRGWYLWNVRSTPFVSGTGRVDLGATVTGQAQDRTPARVVASARLDGRTGAVSIAGRVTEGARGASGATVRVKTSTAVLASVRAAADGRFTAAVRTKAAVLRITASAPERSLAGCLRPLFAPTPCLSATVNGFTVGSGPVRVRR